MKISILFTGARLSRRLLCKIWDIIGNHIPDNLFLRVKFFISMGQKLNLKNPQTFNEKLQWLKLYDRNPLYTTLVDKIRVKDYVSDKIGAKYVIPTLSVYSKPEFIDISKLPDQFVVKTSHGGGGGGVFICKDKSRLKPKSMISQLRLSFKQNIYKTYREWPYKNVPRQILVEKFMSNNGNDLVDYKVHNFNGIPRLILVCKNRNQGEMVEDFYSEEWNLLDISRPGHPKSQVPDLKPSQLDEILQLSRVLSSNIPFVRTDFYIINQKVFFGEMTFFPAAGMTGFEPQEWDLILGTWLQLPNIIK